MRPGQLGSASLALVDGAPRRAAPQLHVATGPNPLLVLAEPVEPSVAAYELAAAVVEDVRRGLLDTQPAHAPARLSAVFQQANDAVRRFNQRRHTGRRIHLGLVCIVATDSDLYIGLTPPAQVLVVQERRLYAFPPLASWDGEQTGFDRPGAQPLGLRAQLDPEILSTRWAPGDLVAVTTSLIAQSLAPQESELAAAANPDQLLSLIGAACDRYDVRDGQIGIVVLGAQRFSNADRAAMRPQHHPAGDSPRTRAAAGRVHPWQSASGYASDTWPPPFSRDEFPKLGAAPLDQNAPTVQTEEAYGWGSGSLGSRVPGEPGVGLGLRPDSWESSTDEFVPLTPPSAAPPARVPVPDDRLPPSERRAADWLDERTVIRIADTPDRLGSRTGTATKRGVPRQLSAPRAGALNRGREAQRVGGNRIVELLAGLVLSLTAAVVGVWQIARRDRSIHGFDHGLTGLPHIEAWKKAHKPPRLRRLRTAAPRLAGGRLLLAVVLVLVLGLAGFYIYSRARVEHAVQVSTFERDFQAIQAQHAAANANGDAASAYAMLLDTRRELDDLAATLAPDSSDSRLADERQAVLADLDHLANVQRFSSVQPLGAVPPAAEGVNPRLVIGGGRVYVLTDALYQLDSADRALVRLLGAGDIVHDPAGDVTAGALRGAAWRDDRLIAVDAVNAYALDPATGNWSREVLGTFDAEGFTDEQAVEVYSRNLYMLAPASGQILKFAAAGYDNQPEDWTAGLAQDDLRHAVDLAIDGHVFVLTGDGKILDFFMARLEATLVPNVVPALDAPIAISASPGSPYVYVLNASDGRLLRVARDGSLVQQFLPDRQDVSFDDARDFVIDEGSGIAFILAHDTLYTVRVPSAPAPAAQPTPEASPTP